MSVAHEVNQPLTAIVTNGNFSLRQLERATPNLDELREAITEIVNDGVRASAVVSYRFARPELSGWFRL